MSISFMHCTFRAECRIRWRTVVSHILIDLFWVMHERHEVLAFFGTNRILESLIVCNLLPMVRLHVLPEEVVFDSALVLSRIPSRWLRLYIVSIFPFEIRHLEQLLGKGDLVEIFRRFRGTFHDWSCDDKLRREIWLRCVVKCVWMLVVHSNLTAFCSESFGIILAKIETMW